MGIEQIKSELKSLNEADLHGVISGAILEIKSRAYHEGFDYGFDRGLNGGYEPAKEAPKSPQQLRDEIVEKAKRDVVELKETNGGGRYYYVNDTELPHSPWCCKADFVINREKRTVVVLMRGYNTPKVIFARGIAKCDPTDCFNVHIGKAIALRRALGLEVPTEYLNAPQPTDVRVGDVVSFYYRDGNYAGNHTVAKTFDADGILRTYDKSGQYTVFESEYGDKIIDDSRDYPIGGICNGEEI